MSQAATGSSGRAWAARLDGGPDRGAGRRGGDRSAVCLVGSGRTAFRCAPWYGRRTAACPGGNSLDPPGPGVYFAMPFAAAGRRAERHGTGQSLRRAFRSGARPTSDSPFVRIVAFARSLPDPCRPLRYVERRHGSAGRPPPLRPPGSRLAAAASFGYDYRARTVWLDDGLAPAPSHHDLCGGHAGRLACPTAGS